MHHSYYAILTIVKYTVLNAAHPFLLLLEPVTGCCQVHAMLTIVTGPLTSATCCCLDASWDHANLHAILTVYAGPLDLNSILLCECSSGPCTPQGHAESAHRAFNLAHLCLCVCACFICSQDLANLKAMLAALRIPIVSGGGVEADDYLAALTQAAEAHG
jgi:hypothetical protein